jgi:energy-coupling factor transporter ATP-binding protein EcfA2
MARIKSVTVRRFKSLIDLTIELGDATLLIGANNSGKSSFLQAMHFAVSIAQSTKLVAEGVSWRKDLFETSISPAQLIYSPVADVLSLASGGRLQESAASRIEIELNAVDGAKTVVGLRRGRNRNIAVSIEGRALGELLMDLEHPFTVYAPGLAGVSRDERFLSPGVVRRIVARGDANLALRNVLRMLSMDPEAWEQFLQDMRALFPAIQIGIHFEDNSDEFIGVYFKLQDGTELPLDAAGTSVLQASQIFAYVGLFRPKVLILDEPDSHLHPDNQRSLCKVVLQAAADRNFQALISTHSRHVLDAMKGHANVIWLSKGQKVDATDLNTTSMLLELGALDSVDYFTDSALKCVVVTEDSDRSPIETLLWSSGFIEDDTEVRTYAGCSKLDAARVLGSFLGDKAPSLKAVIHRDSDFLSSDGEAKVSKDIESTGILVFLTEYSDVEGYFLDPHHLSYLNSGLTSERAQEIVDQATLECEKASIEAIINLRTNEAFKNRKNAKDSVNHGELATKANSDYKSDPIKYRRGKIVLGKVTSLIQAELKVNPRIYLVTPHLKSPRLEALVKEIWQVGADPQA